MIINFFLFLKPWTFEWNKVMTLSYPVLSCPILSYPVLSCPILSYPVLSCPILSYPVLSCPISCTWCLQGIYSMRFLWLYHLKHLFLVACLHHAEPMEITSNHFIFFMTVVVLQSPCFRPSVTSANFLSVYNYISIKIQKLIPPTSR